MKISTHKPFKPFSTYDTIKFNIAAYKEQAKNLPHGWKELSNSKQVDLQQSGYYGTALINEEDKSIVIASSGTNFNFLDPVDLYYDLYNGYQIATQQIPDQFYTGIMPFIEHVLAKLNPETIDDYSITLTGHSLGAVLSELATAELYNKGLKVRCESFDSPGSKPMVKQILSKGNYADIDMELSMLDIIIFNMPNNLVNNYNEQTGDTYIVNIDNSIVINDDNTISYTTGNDSATLYKTLTQHWLSNFVNAFDKVTGDFNVDIFPLYSLTKNQQIANNIEESNIISDNNINNYFTFFEDSIFSDYFF